MSTYLQKILEEMTSIPQRKIEEYKEMFRQYTLAKGRILVDYGEISSRLYFIKKGVVRAFYMRNHEQVTSWIKTEGDVVCATESFFTRKPSLEVLETLEETTMYSISYDQYRSLIQTDHELACVAIRLLEKNLLEKDRWVKGLRFLSVKEKIKYFREHHPTIFRRVPDRIVASCLGISQAAFSRNLAKN